VLDANHGLIFDAWRTRTCHRTTDEFGLIKRSSGVSSPLNPLSVLKQVLHKGIKQAPQGEAAVTGTDDVSFGAISV